MISCAAHDYIEIACLFHLEIRLTLNDSKQIEGLAKTTKTGADKKEYLLLNQQAKQVEVDLENIKKMQAISANPHFDIIEF
jgi:Rho-binding antiterminator